MACSTEFPAFCCRTAIVGSHASVYMFHVPLGCPCCYFQRHSMSVQAVRKDLEDWFGAAEVSGFKFLKLYRIPFSLPSSGAPANLKQRHDLGAGVFMCGDHRMSCSLHDALVSGRRAAAAVTAAASTPASAQAPAALNGSTSD